MKKSALELFVKSFLDSHNPISARKVYILKSIALINSKLNNPFCDDSDAVVDLHTKFDNALTTGVKGILKAVPLKGNKKSYERAVTILERYIGTGCCVQ